MRVSLCDTSCDDPFAVSHRFERESLGGGSYGRGKADFPTRNFFVDDGFNFTFSGIDGLSLTNDRESGAELA